MDAKVSIEVERNVPFPVAGKNGRNGLSKYPWFSMSKGDSFLFPAEIKMPAASGNAHSAQKRTGFKFSCRTTEEGIRCWRVR